MRVSPLFHLFKSRRLRVRFACGVGGGDDDDDNDYENSKRAAIILLQIAPSWWHMLIAKDRPAFTIILLSTREENFMGFGVSCLIAVAIYALILTPLVLVTISKLVVASKMAERPD